MTLRETLDLTMNRLGLTQATIAPRLGTSQSTVSKMRGGSEWEQHWQIFLKLIDLADKAQMHRRDQPMERKLSNEDAVKYILEAKAHSVLERARVAEGAAEDDAVTETRHPARDTKPAAARGAKSRAKRHR